jgi:hypothetical protein
MSGVVVSRDGIFELELIEGKGPSAVYVLVGPEELARSRAGVETAWSCGIEEGPDASFSARQLETSTVTAKGLSTLHTAVIAVDTDNELMSQKFSNNTTAATDYVADLFVRMNVTYERDLNVRLLQGDTILRIATDPYEQSSSGNADYAKLDEFRDYWVATYTDIDRALAIMLSGKQGGSSSASGIAWLDALCSSFTGYAFNQVFKVNYNQGDAGLVAHEIGHNFGSHHTHCYDPPIDQCYGAERGCYSGPTSCPGGPGTLMSYCHLTGCGKTDDFHPTVIAHLDIDMSFATGVCLFEDVVEDTDSPIVSDESAAPRIVAPGDPVTMEASITDEQSGVASAEATIRDGGGSVITTLPMTNTSGDTWQAVFDSSGSPADLCTVDIRAVDASTNANETTAVSAASFEIRSGFTCDLVLTDQTVADSQTWEACGSITSGPAFVVAPAGEAHLAAGTRVVLRNGFTVQSGGVLSLRVDSALEQP